MTSFALQMIDNDQSAPQELWSTNACHIVNNSGHFVSNQNKVKPLTASVTFFWVASQNLKITRSRKVKQPMWSTMFPSFGTETVRVFSPQCLAVVHTCFVPQRRRVQKATLNGTSNYTIPSWMALKLKLPTFFETYNKSVLWFCDTT